MITDKKELFLKLSWWVGRMNEKTRITEVNLETGETRVTEESQPIRPFTIEEYDVLILVLVEVGLGGLYHS